MLLLAALLALLGPSSAAADEETVQGAGYVVSLKTRETAVAGSPIDVAIVLTPTNGYKVNDEYPITLRIEAPADVAVAKARLERADAKAVRHDRAAFDVSLTPKAAGDKALAFTFKFALCSETTCEQHKEALTFKLRVR